MERHVTRSGVFRKVRWLLRGDLLNIARDLILLFAATAPVLLTLVLRFLVPFISGLLDAHLNFDLSPHYPFLVSFFILLPPMFFGTVIGFFIVDERDENILVYFAVTPLSKEGYLGYRLLFPTAAGFLATFLLVYATDLIRFSPFPLLPPALLAAAEAPLVALFLGAFATNKVEVLALAKAIGIFQFGPFAGYLLPAPWHLAAGLLPSYWVSQTFLSAYTGKWGVFILYAAGGIIVHGLYLFYLLRKFGRRIS